MQAFAVLLRVVEPRLRADKLHGQLLAGEACSVHGGKPTAAKLFQQRQLGFLHLGKPGML